MLLTYENRRVVSTLHYLTARYGPRTFEDLWKTTGESRRTVRGTKRTRREFALQIAALIREGYVEANRNRVLTVTDRGHAALMEAAAR